MQVAAGATVFDPVALLTAFGSTKRADYVDGGDTWKEYDSLRESKPTQADGWCFKGKRSIVESALAADRGGLGGSHAEGEDGFHRGGEGDRPAGTPYRKTADLGCLRKARVAADSLLPVAEETDRRVGWGGP